MEVLDKKSRDRPAIRHLLLFVPILEGGPVTLVVDGNPGV
jgi:hypothetical protein